MTGWLDGSEESDGAENFDRKQFEGTKGHLRLLLQKSYKGDDRFKLDKSFKIDTDKSLMPENLLGAISKHEKDSLFQKPASKAKPAATVITELDGGHQQWDPEFDPHAEKQKSFDILAKFVPQSEIFLSSKPQAKKVEKSGGFS